MNAHALGEALALRLNSILPSRIRVSAERVTDPIVKRDADVFVRVAYDDERWGGHGFSDFDLRPRGDASVGDKACDMAIAMLNGVQDSICQILVEPWPRLATGDIVLPGGRVDQDHVYLWFGPSEYRAVLTLDPIEVHT